MNLSLKTLFLLIINLFFSTISFAGVKKDFIFAVWYNVMYLDLKDESKTKKQIEQHIRLLSDMNINTLIFLAKDYKGYVYYKSKYAKSKCSWDVLEYIIKKCREYNIKIYPYINVFSEQGYFLKENPQYEELRKNNKRTNWASPSLKPVRERILNIIKEIIENYDIDGIQLDRIRYPGYNDDGFHPESIKQYKKIYKKEPDIKDPDFYNFKCDLITSFVKESYDFVKSYNKNLNFSAAVFHTPTTAKNNRIAQQWDLWVKNNYLDYVFTMSYTSDINTFKKYLKENTQLFNMFKPKTKLVVGIGVYYEGMNADILKQQINLCFEEENVSGICFFNAYNLFNNNEFMTLLKNIEIQK